jgi:hypothetical protein
MIDGGLRKNFQKHLPQVHWQPVETGLISMGVPDINYCYEGIEGWIEYKKSDLNDRIGFRPEQIGWIKDRLRHGGRVHVAVLVEFPYSMALFHGAIANEWKLLVKDLIHNAMGIWTGSARSWDWAGILAELTRVEE